MAQSSRLRAHSSAMAIVLALIFLAAGIVVLVAYGGTPHGGPTTACGPISFFGHTFTVSADCRYVSAGEIAAAIALFLLAVVTVLLGRPRQP